MTVSEIRIVETRMSQLRHLYRVGLASAALVLAALPQAQASEDVGYWLDRMSRAIETLNYRGTLVHIRDGQVDTLRIIHRSDQDGIRERIYSLDGQPREILRDGAHVRTLLGGDQTIVVGGNLGARLFPNLPLSRLSSPVVAYRMRVAGADRVAGMNTRIVDIRPRDQFRYGHRLWLEENTGMLLRSALLDHEGNRLQQMSFVDIELGVPISDSELDPVLNRSGVVELEMDDVPAERRAAAAEMRRATWTPRHLPDGFRLASVGRGHDREGRPFEHLLFSDGLASFSVYIEIDAGSRSGPSDRIESIGPVHVYTASVDRHRVTVVGEVPPATVAFVARQLERRPAAGPG